MRRVIVYFPNWGTYNQAHNNCTVSMIPWKRIDVVNHAFFTVGADFKLVTTDSWADFEKQFEHSGDWTQTLKGHMGEYKYYKTQYPDKKVMISVGGWTRGENFHAMAATQANRNFFINSIIDFLKLYTFIDGIDIDWEYPGINRQRDPNDEYDRGCPGGPEDKQNYTALLREIREAYNKNGLSNKMLTIASSAGYEKLELQEPNVFYEFLDYINVMTYDIHGAWENVTNHQAAIYPNPGDPSPSTPVDIKNKYNTAEAMKIYTDVYHIPANKLNVGTPFYSRGWKNVDDNTGKDGLFAKANGAPVGSLDNPNSPGGQNSFTALKQLEQTAGYIKYRDNYTKTPYLYNRDQKIMLTYEDEQSLSERCDFVIKNGYGGIFAWEISLDDPQNNTLTTIMYNKMKGAGPNDPPEPTVLGVDQATNIGNYTVTVTIPADNTATAMKLYENDQEVKSGTLVPNQSTSQSISHVVRNKTPGEYTYRCDVKNAYGTTPSVLLKVVVKVPSPLPDPAILSVDSKENYGSYLLTITIPAFNSATAMILYEYDAVLKSQAVTPQVSEQQVIRLQVSDKPQGQYKYVAKLSNDNGVTPSKELVVTVVPKPSNEWTPNKAYKAGDIVSYQNKNYLCRQPHTSLPGWEPSNAPALWQLQ